MEDRPREKLISKGIQSLSDAELLAILIGTGTKNESAVELSKKVLVASKNNLYELGKLSVNELTIHNGIGVAKAITIIAAMELGRRRKVADVLEKEQITSSNDVAAFFHPIVADLPHEEFWVMFLNRANKILSWQKLSQGGISGTVIDVRLIIKQAINALASAMIICHNHPSGNLKPSEADIAITKKIKDAGKIVDIPLLDHIIVAEGGSYSFADEGII